MAFQSYRRNTLSFLLTNIAFGGIVECKIRRTKVRIGIIICGLILVIASLINGVSPVFLKSMIDNRRSNTEFEITIFYGILFIAALGIGRVLSDLRYWMMTSVERDLHKALRFRSNNHLVLTSQSNFNELNSGAYIHIQNQGTRAITVILQNIVLSFIPIAIQIATAIVVISSQVSPLIGLSLCISAILYVFVLSKSSNKSSIAYKDVIKSTSSYTSLVGEFVTISESVRLLQAQHYAKGKLDRSASEVDRSTHSFQQARLRSSLLASAIYVMMIGGILGWSTIQFSSGEMTAGVLVMVVTYLLQFLQPLEALSFVHRDLSQAISMFEQSAPILAHQPAPIRKLRAPQSDVVIEFDNVSFSYPSRSDVIRGVSFAVRRGEHIAFVGKSGSGKTTIARIIAGLYEPSNGTVLFRLGETDPKSVGKLVGFLPQDTSLFDDSLLANITLDETHVDHERLNMVVCDVGLESVIASLPDGLGSRVGPRGAKLSAGERQRVGLARLLYRKCDLFILDEPTSSLDAKSESQIDRAIKTSLRHFPVITIAHRLNTIRRSDRIIVIDDGAIVGTGTHNELLKTNQIYKSLWESLGS